MSRQHRLVWRAIAQRAAEVNRLAAQYEEDAQGNDRRSADFAGTRRRRRLPTPLSGDRSQETGGAFLLVHLS